MLSGARLPLLTARHRDAPATPEVHHHVSRADLILGFVPASLWCSPEVALRRRARALVATAGSRLRLAAGRVGGEPGLALACAFIDMVDANVDPLWWPIGEVIALLQKEAARDRQVARLLHELGEIEDRLSMDPDDDRADAAVRTSVCNAFALCLPLTMTADIAEITAHDPIRRSRCHDDAGDA